MRWRQALPALLLLGVTVAAYWPAIGGSFVWDDDKYVTDNWTLRSTDGLKSIWFDPAASPQYYPLTLATFWIEYHLWGLHPFWYHLVNVLLHATSAIILWLLLRRLSIPGALIAAALFAVHPVHVESVAWVTELKNVLSGVFYLAALYTYFRFWWGRHWDLPPHGWSNTTWARPAYNGSSRSWSAVWLPVAPCGSTWQSWSGPPTSASCIPGARSTPALGGNTSTPSPRSGAVWHSFSRGSASGEDRLRHTRCSWEHCFQRSAFSTCIRCSSRSSQITFNISPVWGS